MCKKKQINTKIGVDKKYNYAINSICSSTNYHLRNIARIRKNIDHDTCHHVVRCLVTSRLDYCNSLLYGIRDVGYWISMTRGLNDRLQVQCSCDRYMYDGNLPRDEQ